MEEAKWYAIHTYSGYEKKVKMDIENTIKNRNLTDQILEVLVPMREVVEFKNGVRKAKEQKMFPGYVLVRMIMNDNTWYVVRNTRGVTGFVGPGSKPVPLAEEEIAEFRAQDDTEVLLDFEVGDMVTVKTEPWKGNVGVVRSIDKEHEKATIYIDMFGRETPLEVEFTDIERKL